VTLLEKETLAGAELEGVLAKVSKETMPQVRE